MKWLRPQTPAKLSRFELFTAIERFEIIDLRDMEKYNILLFQVPTSVEMAEQRKYMMPVDDGRYHLTIYFKDPKKICNAPAGRDRNNEKRFLIQTGPNWKSIMNVPINENELESTLWVKGSFVLVMGMGEKLFLSL